VTAHYRASRQATTNSPPDGWIRVQERDQDTLASMAASSRSPAKPGRATSPTLARVIAAGLLPLIDTLALAAAVAIAGRVNLAVVGYAGAVLVLLAVTGQHRLRICARVSDQVGRIVGATWLPLLVLVLISPSASAAWKLAIAAPGCVVALRGLAYRVLGAAHRRQMLTEPTLVAGASEQGVQAAELMLEHPELGLRPVGFLDHCDHRHELPLPVVGELTDLPTVVRQSAIRRVLVCLPAQVCPDSERDMAAAIRLSRRLPVDICVVPRMPDLGSAIPRSHLDELWGIPVVPVRRIGPASMVLKRVFDVLAALLLLVLAAPLLLLLAAAIRLRAGRPVIFRQERVTGEDRVVEILKLRTLEPHTDSDTRWGVPTEGSTRLGQWLRASHLDELPQLVNVLRGDMSLVGPRPERPYFVACFSDIIEGYKDRTRMRAGLTGWAQVHGLHGDTSMKDRVRFDNYYIEYWSPWLDLVIVFRTLAAAVSAGWLGKR
jgi:exopolysaccharide biosynthesis polyprenyl glycosylphosphotransferase